MSLMNNNVEVPISNILMKLGTQPSDILKCIFKKEIKSWEEMWNSHCD